MKRSKFNLSHYHLLTGNMGELLPAGLVEVLPGDTFQHHTNVLIRLSPMAAPVMHGMQVRVHHWFVPHRLVWDGFEEFITGGPDGRNADTVPQITAQGPSSLADYFGIPEAGVSVSALPFRAYNTVFNEWYRDQDLVPEVDLSSQNILKCAWEKDYFTTARPWSQKGDTVTVPLGQTAVVRGLATESSNLPTNLLNATDDSDSGMPAADYRGVFARIMNGAESVPYPKVYADLSAATGTNVNDLRRAFALQRFAEARARYGSRYTEYLRYLGVRPKDGRLERPEFLGGGQIQVSVSEILQTAPESGSGPGTEYGVGDMYGHGIAALRSNAYRRTFDEHGYVLSLLSVRPKAIYVSGVPRSLLRLDREDFFQRELQFIGQQEIWRDEVFASNDGSGRTTWGYQDRYREYREQPSSVSGEFRELLNYWHLARDFDQAPGLNASFITCDPSKRIFNVQGNDTLWVMCQHRLAARRLVAGHAAGRIV